jgi:photosystem II stability/assembly factor-like uncharacterized protein
MKVFILIIFLFLSGNVKSQWVSQNSNSLYTIEDIHFVDNNIGFHCGIDGIYTTINGGSNWSQIMYSGSDSLTLVYSPFNEILFLNPSTGIAVGRNVLSSKEVIARTSDGGVTWSVAYMASTSGYELYDVSFSDAVNGVAVGSGGKIVNTNDGGVNWSPALSGTTADLFGVEFFTPLIGVAVGSGVILRTIDGGLSWSITNNGYSLRDVDLQNNTNGFAVGVSGNILKTLDAGVSWQTVETFTDPETYLGVHFTSVDTGYVVSGSGIMLKTTSGGTYWEKQTMGGALLKTIFFSDSNTGYTAGYSGALLKTMNQGEPYYPISSFDLTTNVFCHDSLIYFTNNGPNTYNYEWYVDNNLVSNTTDLITFFSGDATYNITLIANNSQLSDTADVLISVEQSTSINLSTVIDFDTICAGESANITVLNSELGAIYELNIGGVSVGTAQSGNGGALIFNTGNLPSSETFNLLATKLNSCDTNDVINIHNIVIAQPNTSLIVNSNSNVLCINDSTIISINSSELVTAYQLYDGVNFIGDSVFGNGGTIQLPTGAIADTTTFSILATNIYGCSDYLVDMEIIDIRNLLVDFLPSEHNIFIGDTLFLSNLANADFYQWELIGADTTYNNSGFEPGIAFDTSGIVDVWLFGSTLNGCIDSAFSQVHVFNRSSGSNGSYCFFDTISQISWPNYWSGHLLAHDVDIQGSSYIGGCYDHPFQFNTPASFLRKFDSNGNLKWEKIQNPYNYNGTTYYESSFVTGITSDTSMNLYITGSYCSNRYQVDTFDIVASNGSYANTQHYISKIDSNGMTQWIIHSDNPWDNEAGGTDILYISNDYIAISIYQPTETFFPDGTSQNMNGELAILLIDSDGNYVNHYSVYPSAFNPNNISLLNWSNSGWNTSSIATVSPKLRFGTDGKIYVVGKFENTLTFGTTQINEIYDESNCYVAKLNPLTGWEDAFVLYGRNTGYQGGSGATDPGIYPIFTMDESNNIYVTEHSGTTQFGDTISIQFNNGEIVKGNKHGVLAKFNSSGDLIWYNLNLSLRVKGIANYSDNEIILFGEYDDFVGIESQSIGEYGYSSIGDFDLSIVSIDSSGNTNWIDNLGSIGRDDAFFLTKNKCGELYFLGNLQDSSSNAYDTLNYTGDHLFSLHFSPDSNCTFGCNQICLPTYVTDAQSACNSYTWIDGNTYTTSNNMTTYILTDPFGCDSIMTLNLFIAETDTVTQTETTCGNFTWIDGNTYTTSNNTATYTLDNIYGCDSVVTLNLTVSADEIATQTETECDNFTWIDGNTYTNSNSIATHTLSNIYGCDSVVTLNLIINLADTGVTQSGTVLTANAMVADYQWLNCDNNYSPVIGENSQSFTPSTGGNYAVEIIQNGCTSISSCYNISYVGIGSYSHNDIRVFPNPNKGSFFVECHAITNDCLIQVIDQQGKVILRKQIETGLSEIEASHLSKGLYYIQIINNNNVSLQKLVIN